MANRDDLKELAQQHLKTAEILIRARDYAGAAYMLGYVLEFALKSAACKTLNLVSYPESGSNERISSFFKAHNFDQLIMISGLTDLFDFRGSAGASRNWSDFTGMFLGEWPRMRYDLPFRKQFNEKTLKKLYNNLTDSNNGILTVIEKNKRW